MAVTNRVKMLLDTRAREGLDLDWKDGLPEDRTEFLADVTSLANTIGGVLVFCVSEERIDGEKTGRPEALNPADPSEAQRAQERCNNWLADSVQPRVPMAHVHLVDAAEFGEPAGAVLIVEIERSWVGPHMVSRDKGRWSMYKRNSYGKRPLDPQEMRAAFNEAASVSERIAELRRQALADLDAWAIPRAERSAVLLQLAPLGWWQEERVIDYTELMGSHLLDTLTGGFYRQRLNLDGAFVWRQGDGTFDGDAAFTQFFRSGRADYVDTYPVFVESADSGKTSFLASEVLRPGLAKTLGQYAELLDRAGLAEPVAMILTVHDVDKFALAADKGYARHPFDRRTLALPPLVVDRLDATTIDHAVVDLMTDIYRAAGEAEIPYKYADAEDG